MKLSSIVAGATLFVSSAIAADLDPIVITGSKFFYKSNDTQLCVNPPLENLWLHLMLTTPQLHSRCCVPAWVLVVFGIISVT